MQENGSVQRLRIWRIASYFKKRCNEFVLNDELYSHFPNIPDSQIRVLTTGAKRLLLDWGIVLPDAMYKKGKGWGRTPSDGTDPRTPRQVLKTLIRCNGRLSKRIDLYHDQNELNIKHIEATHPGSVMIEISRTLAAQTALESHAQRSMVDIFEKISAEHPDETEDD